MDELQKLIVYYMLHYGCNKEDAIASIRADLDVILDNG